VTLILLKTVIWDQAVNAPCPIDAFFLKLSFHL